MHPRNEQAKPPCAAASATREYVRASADSSYAAAPSATAKLARNQNADTCKALCERRASRPRDAPAGCAAFSVSVLPHRSGNPARAARYCNFFDASVPWRLCGADDKDGLCANGSEGSFRVKYSAA